MNYHKHYKRLISLIPINHFLKNKVTGSIIALLEEYSWKKFSIVYQLGWRGMVTNFRKKVCLIQVHGKKRLCRYQATRIQVFYFLGKEKEIHHQSH